MTTAVRTGGCLCGAVRYTLRGNHSELTFCHCGQCRRAHGSTPAAVLAVPRDDFEIAAGVDALKAWRASAAKQRVFCRECGSPLYSVVDGASQLRLRAGSLDDPAGLHGLAHIFCEDAVDWFDDSELPRYPGREPGRRP